MMKNQLKKGENNRFYFYGTKTVQYKGKDLTRRVTVGGVLSEDGTNISIATAMCSEKDNFCKKKGRNIATSRASMHPETRIPVQNHEHPGKDFTAKAKELVDFQERELAD